MASIADAAGLGRNTIHRHFPTRQDLLDAVRLQASDDAAANDLDALRPAGELGSPVPTLLQVSEILNKVPPFLLGEQIVAEAQRLSGVASAAFYVVDLDGVQLRRLAGAETFPESLPIDHAVGPEIPREAVPAIRAAIEALLPSVVVAPMYLRGRATGLLVALGTRNEDGLRELAGTAAAALGLAGRYTDQGDRAARSRPTSASAEIQQHMLPPRIVRVIGAIISGNVTPSYEIGGDWFDYADNPEGTWLGIADTQGAGPRTAAVASVILGAFRSARHLDDATPASVARAMNQTVRDLGDLAVPVAVTVAIWQGATGLVQWTTCGPVRPVLVTSDGAVRSVGESHPELGAADFPRHLRIQSQRLSPGDRMLFVSDGLLERATPDGTAFGIAGIERIIGGLSGSSAPATVRALADAARDHTADPFRDDATIMVLAPTAPPREP